MQIGRIFRLNGRWVVERDQRPIGFSLDEAPPNDREETERVEEIVKRAVEQYGEALEKLADE